MKLTPTLDISKEIMMSNDDSLLHLLDMMAEGPDNYITRQEKQGQHHVSTGAQFPVEIRGASKEDMEGVGFIFGERIDDLFQKVTLPPGWRIEPTDHSLWSDILDEEGEKRGSIFYKAAFYDRAAFASMTLAERK